MGLSSLSMCFEWRFEQLDWLVIGTMHPTYFLAKFSLYMCDTVGFMKIDGITSNMYFILYSHIV